MHIAIFTEHFLPKIGGTEIAIVNLAKAMIRLGHKVSVFVSKGLTLKHYEFVDKDGDIQIEKRFVKLASFLYTKRFLKYCQDIKVDLIHCHSIVLLTFVLKTIKIAKIIKVRHILTLHTDLITNLLIYTKSRLVLKIYNKILSKIFAKTDIVSQVSSTPLKSFNKYGVKTSNNFVIVRNGVNFHKISQSEKEKLQEYFYNKFPHFRGKKIISMVARASKVKNTNFALRSLAKLKNVYPNFVFIFAGGGSYLKVIKRQASRLGLNSHVFFPGSLKKEELFELFSVTNIHFFPSFFDTDGLVVNEAAAFNIPSVVIENTGASERFVNNESAFIIKDSTQAASDKILEIIDDSHLLNAVGKKAYSCYQSWDEIAQQYILLATKM
ncbi:GDP-mannose-dependent alpha-(1-6)-phosphatidylinositol monomannoside mannosyltransferase [Mesomycoplasma conjunctivae]|uniref:CONSERVED HYPOTHETICAL Hypothetical transmembrane protein n=1 Tax=Mesomycoplasma conjunctivae (strain ATCC 25834 / NCTC 10147 / HRC/581) TaxID=572263 RepID=C5J656_MESCH|nr:glycosyltransferase family 4 protein [Mesomycoplasma conjunctivae]CAT04948.1 CONSERVED HYPOTHETICAL Hypothetical transmembrane protein [Mesomycoplasma conjunctivae]VEU66101.1 GDP-mannose-dependent alpha-(1-6)-phosphatidylinositol monomannoside mannosyltransferase [Mesomycoplasma conjunctivae]